MELIKEDQTQLITARLEHLQFIMESGKMPIFRHRSDMFLFALEAYNIARGLSSRYYRLQEDLDIRFFVRFKFDYWLAEIEKWIKQLCDAEYRVDDDDFFAEGRAKRLTIVVDKLFGYHIEKLPQDSAEGSMPLPDDEILEPFKAILDMKSTSLVESFKNALREVHKYLERLAMMPAEWSEETHKKALRLYLKDIKDKDHVKTGLNDYQYFCKMPDGKTVTNQICYLKRRLVELTACGEFAQLNLPKSEQAALLGKLNGLFSEEETHPSGDQIPQNSKPLAEDELFAKFLYFVRLDGVQSFPLLNEALVSNYLTRKDVFLTEEQENNLQVLYALMEAMNTYLDPILRKRFEGLHQGDKLQERIDIVLNEVKGYNAKLETLIAHGHKIDELNLFFQNLFSPKWRENYSKAQTDLLGLFEKERAGINLKTYIHMLRVAHNQTGVFAKKAQFGQDIYKCLEGDNIVEGANAETVNTYFSKNDYRGKEKWKKAITLVVAVEEEYRNTK